MASGKFLLRKPRFPSRVVEVVAGKVFPLGRKVRIFQSFLQAMEKQEIVFIMSWKYKFEVS